MPRESRPLNPSIIAAIDEQSRELDDDRRSYHSQAELLLLIEEHVRQAKRELIDDRKGLGGMRHFLPIAAIAVSAMEMGHWLDEKPGERRPVRP